MPHSEYDELLIEEDISVVRQRVLQVFHCQQTTFVFTAI